MDLKPTNVRRYYMVSIDEALGPNIELVVEAMSEMFDQISLEQDPLFFSVQEMSGPHATFVFDGPFKVDADE